MRVALFGAGRDGINTLHKLGNNRIDFFIDNNLEGEIEGIPIKTLDQIDKEEEKNLLILITSKKYKNEMISQLKKAGFDNYLEYFDEPLNVDYNTRLSAEQWGGIYNESILEEVLTRLKKNILSEQSQEMLRITHKGERILEIGCGSGETSLVLAQNNRIVTAIDCSHRSIVLVNKLAEKMGCSVNTYCLDALNELPFEDIAFDVVFQAGLLEHFEKDQRIKMLLKWKRVCKIMVSLIPNAHCIAYRAGKHIAEKNKTWNWGLEMPQSSLREEFEKAGYVDIHEYSIGEYHALKFLPEDHYLRVAINRWLDENNDMKNLGQGYLLVTMAKNPEI